MKKVSVFLPCRKGSERVPKKNIKPFADFENGLIAIKLDQLVQVESVSNIVLSTNDEEILEYAQGLNHPKIQTHKRIESLSTSQTSTDQLVGHALELIPEGHILWTHVTSPFLNGQTYEEIISTYFNKLDRGYDSLMTTNLIHGFLWNEAAPINYDRALEKWPRTQTLAPIHEINSGVFLASAHIYRELQDRIGEKTYLYPLDKIQGFDIDWEDDFKIAEAIIQSGIGAVCKERALDLSAYQTLVFDCDGVVLNSNKIKTQAFYDVAIVYGTEAAQTLKDYHVQNGGISRYAKFEYLITEVLKKPLEKNELQQLLESFSHEVKQALMTCEVAEGLGELRAKTKHAKWLIVSGSDQAELREVFAARGLEHYFDSGIFGSPDTKDTILERELSNNSITKSALFLGDSKYDYQAAKLAGLDFVFLTDWTEVNSWKLWCVGQKIKAVNAIKTLGVSSR